MKFKDGIVLRKVMDQPILIDNSGELKEIIKLNDTAEVICKALLDGKSLEDAAVAVCEEFDIDAASAQNDVKKFAETLKNKGIIEEC